MSGDVQPRKRKDKKKKKDDLGVEEPRGTAATLGEGDVFMHSYHDHGTGGHWCAKIIFFSLLAVLVTLVGLIILENRGLSELEANSVESRYSGVLEGWIEEAVDDHHDEHTLELKHHDDEDHVDDQMNEDEEEDESLEEEIEHDDDSEEEDEDQNDDEKDESENDYESPEEEIEQDDSNEEAEDKNYNMYDDNEGDESDNEDDEKEMNDDDDDDEDNEDEIGSDDDEIQNDNDEDSTEEDDVETNEDSKYYDNEGDNEEENRMSNVDEVDEDDIKFHNYHEHHAAYESEENKYDYSDNPNNEDEADDNDENDEDEQEIEKIEKEVIDDSGEYEDAGANKEEADSKEDIDRDDSDEDEPPIEQISRPQAGKPFVEIEEESQVKPADTLAEEEAYERQQEELRRQEEETSHSVWLKLFVGGALLAATHAVLRRSNVPHDLSEETVTEEAPTVIDRRMTIIEEPIEVTHTTSQTPQKTDDQVFKRPAPVQSADSKPRTEEEIVKKAVEKVLNPPKTIEKTEEEKELYSEEEDEEEDAEEDVEEDKPPKKEIEKEVEEEDEPEPEEVSDVEIIYDETIEEEEDVEEEEISDVDDTELLSRLEAKYGRLPEPERPGQYKGGAKSVSSEWPGEPSDSYWRSQLDAAEEELRQGAWSACITRVSVAELENSGRARWLRAKALDLSAEATRDNQMLSRAITAYLHLLKMNDNLSDDKLLEVARRTIDRIQFRGVYLNAEPVYRLLIRRFPEDVTYRNNLTISFLMANRADLADEVLRETLRLWPNDRIALAHHGYILKNHYNNLEEAVRALRKALEGDGGQANEPRFYYHLGDALLLLGRFDEAYEVHKRGAELGHFLSASQRSLYNVPRLKSQPWWRVEDTPYEKLARALENSWRDILKEGQRLRSLYEQEKEGLKKKGEWSQMDIMVQGREIPGRCARAPVTCSVVKSEPAAAGCRRGQVKFSMMAPGTHVRPHVGPTNCRLRMHLGLSNTENTFIRVDKEIRQWRLGKTLLFDDSFEHEVWHNGTGARLVLIVDVWHPDLTPAEKRQLPSI